VITPAALDATDAYIASAQPAPALARLLAEGRDDVARALRCRDISARASRG
jgi:aminopeptidase N